MGTFAHRAFRLATMVAVTITAIVVRTAKSRTMLTTGPFNATRNPQNPLLQPSYCFQHVPKAQRDLTGSTLHIISNANREQFQKSMAEMLLLCKEAIRRRRRYPVGNESNVHTHHLSIRPGRTCSPRKLKAAKDIVDSLKRNDGGVTTHSSGGGSNKPLSLEYIADRIDIDDPCFGFMIRTAIAPPSDTLPDPSAWKKGMLQGFITVTTFTNWQKSFRWDSLNEAAYYDDDDEEDGSDSAKTQARRLDIDGSLARELQNSVRCGDIHMEGIVWPRIAEISLLGGLGCGATLISLLIEQLEAAPPSVMANYDYVVLQATDNSIPFYESMGFVRVGAIMLEEDISVEDDPTNAASMNLTTDNQQEQENPFITSPVMTYQVKNNGETLTRIAAKFQVDVWDVIFLNRHVLGTNARPCDKPKLNALLLIPAIANEEEVVAQPVYVPSSEIRWHIAKENDTPRTIAKMYNLSTYDVVEKNKCRLPGLVSSSRLKEGTRVKVSHLDVPENLYKPYAHWSFPDSKYEDPEPSYMMVRKLHRRRVRNCNLAEGRLFLSSLKASVVDNDASSPSLFLSPLSPSPKMEPSSLHHSAQSHQPFLPLSENDPIIKASLYNKVVRLKPGAMTEGSNYLYWYVLTFIPDLKWCHLAPMVQDGMFGIDKPKACGRAKWRLVDESFGHEVDLSSSYCIPVKSRSMRKTLDADKEEWDIVDDGTDPTALSRMSSTGDLSRQSSVSLSIQPRQRGMIAIKPSVERSRKQAAIFIAESPSLLAALPGSGRITTVRLIGKLLFGNESGPKQNSLEVKRGRPAGAKNKPKNPESMSGARPVEGGNSVLNLSCCTPGKKRRASTVQFNVPASARKAAALRTSNFAFKSSEGRRRSSTQVASSSCLMATAADPSDLKAAAGTKNQLKKMSSKAASKVAEVMSGKPQVQPKGIKRNWSSVFSDGVENDSSPNILQVISEGDSHATSDSDSVYCSSSSSASSSQDDFSVEISSKSRKKKGSVYCAPRRSLRHEGSSSLTHAVDAVVPTLRERFADKSTVSLAMEVSERRTKYSRQARINATTDGNNPTRSMSKSNRPKRKAASSS
jgi:LysM domain